MVGNKFAKVFTYIRTIALGAVSAGCPEADVFGNNKVKYDHLAQYWNIALSAGHVVHLDDWLEFPGVVPPINFVFLQCQRPFDTNWESCLSSLDVEQFLVAVTLMVGDRLE